MIIPQKIIAPHSIMRDHGFSFLTIIVAMFLVTTLVSAGMMMIGPLMKGRRNRDAVMSIDKITDDVMQYNDYTKNKSKLLPLQLCYGPEGLNRTSNVNQNTQIRDAWGNQLIYLADTNLTHNTASTGTEGVCFQSYTTTKLQVNNVKNIAFVIVSRGDDLSFNTSINGTLLSDTSPNQTDIATYSSIVTPANQSNDPDIIKYVTLNELKIGAGCYRPIQISPFLNIINKELRSATAFQQYSSDPLVAFGGVLFPVINLSYNTIQYQNGSGTIWPSYHGSEVPQPTTQPYKFTLISSPSWLKLDYIDFGAVAGYTGNQINPAQMKLISIVPVPGPPGTYPVIIELSDTTLAATGKSNTTIRKTYTLKVN